MQTAIHRGFADAIDSLNEKTTALCALPDAGQRRYAYAGPIHMTIVGENPSFHKMHLEKVASNPALQGGVYAGAAGLVNLAYIAESKASAALLFDINAYQTLFWNLVFEKIKANACAGDFRKDFCNIAQDIHAAQKDYPATLRENFRAVCHGAGTTLFKDMSEERLGEWIRQDSRNSTEGRWLHDPSLYTHIRELVQENAIGAVTLDITNGAACKQVEKYLWQNGGCARLLYASNILNFLQPVIRRTDFIGRRISDRTQQNTKENLYGWMEENGHIIECDNLERNTPLLVPARIFKPGFSAPTAAPA